MLGFMKYGSNHWYPYVLSGLNKCITGICSQGGAHVSTNHSRKWQQQASRSYLGLKTLLPIDYLILHLVCRAFWRYTKLDVQKRSCRQERLSSSPNETPLTLQDDGAAQRTWSALICILKSARRGNMYDKQEYNLVQDGLPD